MNINFISQKLNIYYLKKNINTPLYKNSFNILLGRTLNIAGGFFFWIIATKLYAIEDVGIAIALVSSQGLISLFSKLGFETSLIRFMPIENKNKVFNTCLIVTTLSSFIFGIVYVLTIDIISPKLIFLKSHGYFILFIFFTVINLITDILGQSFIAMKETKRFLIQNVMFVLRIPLLFILLFLGKWGIFCSIGFAYTLAAIASMIYLGKNIHLNLKIDSTFLKNSFRFSSKNYISNVLLSLPSLILPILILNILGEEASAIYYIVFNINNVILLFPEAVSLALFVEGSYGENLKQNLIKSTIAIYSVLIPSILFVYIYGDSILNFLGSDYLEALELLKIFAISSFFVVPYSLFSPIQNIRMKVSSIIKINAVRFLIFVGLCYLFIFKFGIIGVGYSWLFTYVVLSMCIIILYSTDCHKNRVYAVKE